jgi:hypothetical protein
MEGRMFNAAYGVWVVTEPGSASLEVFETRDSGQNFIRRSDTYLGGSPDCAGALLLDTLHYVVALRTNAILLSSDGGASWDTAFHPPSITFFEGISSYSTPDNIYVLGGSWNGKSYSSSFFKSTNGGIGWDSDSTIYGNRIARLAASSKDHLWAIVRHTLQSFADSLLFSTDNGITWGSDPSFIGDTLLDIIWPDSDNGFVYSYKDHNAIIDRYSSTASVGAVSEKIITPSVFPNPASSEISVQGFGPGLSIIDAIGRSELLPAGKKDFDISTLLPGIYYLTDGRSYARFIKE